MHYSKAIELDGTDPRFFSNRAQVYIKLKAYSKAIEDSETAIQLDPQFTRAYCRKAEAEYEEDCLEQAQTTIEEGLLTITQEKKQKQDKPC